MPDYVYRLTDLVSRRVLSDLPLAVSSLPRNLSADVDAISPTLDMRSGGLDDDGNLQGVSKLAPYTATIPGRTGLFALRDGQPVWGGIIWAREYDSDSKQLKLTVSTAESYWRHRYLAGYLTYTSVDTATVALALMGSAPLTGQTTLPGQYVWLPSNGSAAVSLPVTSGTVTDYDGTVIPVAPSIGIDLPVGVTTGHTMTISYPPGKNMYDALIEIAQSYQGLDFTCDPILRSDGTLGWRLRMASQLGRPVANTNFSFTYGQHGSSVLSYGFVEDSRTSAIREIDTGQEENGAVPFASVGALAPLRGGYPLLEVATSYPDTSDPTTLQARATSPLSGGIPEVATSNWTVKADDSEVPFGGYNLGDQSIFAVSDELTPRQADGTAGRYSIERIVGWDLQPEARGQLEQVKLLTNPITQATPKLPPTLKKRLDDFNRRLGGVTSVSKIASANFVAQVTDPTWTTIPNSTSSGPGTTVYLTYLIFTVQSPVLYYQTVCYNSTGSGFHNILTFSDANTGFTATNSFVPVSITTTADGANADPDISTLDVSSYPLGSLAVILVQAAMSSNGVTNPTGTQLLKIRYAGNQRI